MPEFPETSYSLIARVKDLGDGAAWTEFLGIYQPVVFRMARRRGLQDADAQDVMQQVFLSISKSIEGWTPGDLQPPFRAWLTTISRNAITKALTRRPRDAATGSTSMVELLGAHPDPQETTAEILAEARKELIRWATEQIRSEFSEATWKVFWLTAIEGVSIAEVAKSMGRSAGAVYVARYRVIAKLKEKVSEVSQLWDLQENEP
ncbi:MAG: sigma-70 family RNA polymerase sigma factor [Planctomycetaceae bacterium]|nr:sigma-70 family RNA polymerase sigma factor [Planctomycetaceae bacterium]